MEKQIDKDATYSKVREKYGSVLAFCRAHSTIPQVFYGAVCGNRGTDKGRKAIEATRVMTVLRTEGLLVERSAC